MKVWKTAAVVVLSITVITSYGFAQTPNGPGRGGNGPGMGGNGPGMGRRCLQRFAALDTDNNGMITFSEFEAVSHPRGDTETIFTSRDANGDGVLTKVEFCPGI
ncbi:MAG: EF-hand domain-containing protein [Candidatus Electrothrix sp. AR4]|nr:EF-hand domain-containing protein [Candidatus Electrothrix sp. AR4]